MRRAVTGADQLITVSVALQALAIKLGANPARVQVIGNGVDLARFTPAPRLDARRQLGLPADAEVLVSVGMLSERKGFHRVIECLPGLLPTHPALQLMIVGGAGREGDVGAELRRMTRALGLDDRVHLLGPLSPDGVNLALSAADVFVLATSYEGWANVFLKQWRVVCRLSRPMLEVTRRLSTDRSLGCLVPFGNTRRLQEAIDEALRTPWDRTSIRAYAEANSWDRRVQPLIDSYHGLLLAGRTQPVRVHVETGSVR